MSSADTQRTAQRTTQQRTAPDEGVSPRRLLPREMWLEILKRLLPAFAPALREVCRAWRNIVQSLRDGPALADTWGIAWQTPTLATLAARGHLRLLKWVRARGASSVGAAPWSQTKKDRLLQAACFTAEAPMPTVAWLLKHGASDYDTAMNGAAGAGNLALMDLMRVRGGRNFSHAMHFAASMGRLDAVDVLLGWGANEYDRSMELAAASGHLAVVERLLAAGATDYDAALILAAWRGREEIMRLLLARGATNANMAMASAARGGQLAAVRLLLDYGADDRGRALENAAAAGHLATVHFLLDAGAVDCNRALELAAWHGFRDIVRLLLDRGASNAASTLAVTHDTEIRAMLQAHAGLPPNRMTVLYDDPAADATADEL